MAKPAKKAFNELYAMGGFLGYSNTMTEYAFVVDEKDLAVYYRIFKNGKPDGDVYKVKLNKFDITNPSMNDVAIGDKDSLDLTNLNNEAIVNKIKEIKAALAERNKTKTVKTKTEPVKTEPKKSEDKKVEDKKMSGVVDTNVRNIFGSVVRTVEQERIVKLAELSKKLQAAFPDVDKGVWTVALYKSMKNNVHWGTNPSNTAAQNALIQQVNAQFDAWTQADAQKLAAAKTEQERRAIREEYLKTGRAYAVGQTPAQHEVESLNTLLADARAELQEARNRIQSVEQEKKLTEAERDNLIQVVATQQALIGQKGYTYTKRDVEIADLATRMHIQFGRTVEEFDADIRNSFANGEFWNTSDANTPEQNLLISDINKAMKNWMVEDRISAQYAERVLPVSQQRRVQMARLARELQTAFPNEDKSAWTVALHRAAKDNIRWDVNPNNSAEQNALIERVNSQLNIWAAADKANENSGNSREIRKQNAVRVVTAEAEAQRARQELEAYKQSDASIMARFAESIEKNYQQQTALMERLDRHEGNIAGIIAELAALREAVVNGQYSNNNNNNNNNTSAKTKMTLGKKIAIGLATVGSAVVIGLLSWAGVSLAKIANNSGNGGSGSGTTATTPGDEKPGNENPGTEKPGSDIGSNGDVTINNTEIANRLTAKFGEELDMESVVTEVKDGVVTVTAKSADGTHLYQVKGADKGNDGKVTQDDMYALLLEEDYVMAEQASVFFKGAHADRMLGENRITNADNTYFFVETPDADYNVTVYTYVYNGDSVKETKNSGSVSATKYANDADFEQKAIEAFTTNENGDPHASWTGYRRSLDKDTSITTNTNSVHELG